MNKQEVFNRVVAHARKQGTRSISYEPGGARCMYRGPEGTSCFVGCLIADEAYKSDLEGELVSHEDVLKALYESGVDIESCPDLSFLEALQRIHDSDLPHRWESQLAWFAACHHLTYTSPEASK